MNPCHPRQPQAISNPAARVFKNDMNCSARLTEFPCAATTYRLTEHFHYWTEHCRLNAITQPEQFVEIGEGWKLGINARRQGQGLLQPRLHQGGGGGDKAHPPAAGGRQTVHHVGIPIHWGFAGMAAQRLPGQHPGPFVGDGIPDAGVPSFLVNVEKDVSET